MGVRVLASVARAHWAEFLPRKSAQLRADGQFDQATLRAARKAQVMIDSLVHEEGWRARDAEEAAMRKFILLPPEVPDDDGCDDEEPLDGASALGRAVPTFSDD
jgi:hypothetical protein